MRNSAIPKSKWKTVGKLYMSGLSMRMVAERFGVSIDAVVYVLRKTGVRRRTTAETNRLLYEAQDPSFSVKKPRSQKEKDLHLIGAMLYWAEGYKQPSALGIDFANSDPEMARLFMRFLRTRYVLDEERIRASVYCYANQDTKKIIQFWSTMLEIPKEKFIKPYIRKDHKKGVRQMPHGLVHIRYHDKKLLRDVLGLIESCRHKYCVGGRAVNCTGL